MSVFRFLRLAGLIAALLAGSGAAVAAAPAKVDTAAAAAAKKAGDRYALNKARIAALLELRLNPAPLPATLPNPFYHSPDLPVAETTPAAAPDTIVPAAPDSSDADTLARFVATLKIGGVVYRNNQPFLTINSILCKPGDVIPAGSRDHPIYIQVVRISEDDLTLALNQAQQTLKVRK